MKLYADEPQSGEVRELQTVVVSELARVEVPAALWRKHRLGDIEPNQVAVLVAAFEADWYEEARFAVVAVSSGVLEEAARHLARHPLRAYDAIQLASATSARELHPQLDRFVGFDRALLAAAAAEGFVTAGA